MMNLDHSNHRHHNQHHHHHHNKHRHLGDKTHDSRSKTNHELANPTSSSSSSKRKIDLPDERPDRQSQSDKRQRDNDESKSMSSRAHSDYESPTKKASLECSVDRMNIRGKLDLDEGCRSSDLYERLEKIGEGTYGSVYKAKCTQTGKLVAMKKLKLESEKEGFPITSIREMFTLVKGKHPNVINIIEIVFGSRLDQIYIVMEYMDHDLKSLMKQMTRPFEIAEIKLLMQQLLDAVAHLHKNWILHRDLKTSNLLISKGALKIGDFGLAREYGSPLKQYTNNVETLWYRAPELLLQTGRYSTAIDVWAVGCIFGELVLQQPLFQGRSESSQIDLIFKTLGSPKPDLWPDYEKIRLAKNFSFPRYPSNRLPERLSVNKSLSRQGLHLLTRLLAYDPGVKPNSDPDSNFIERSHHRIRAEIALKHEFFDEEPHPIHPDLFPTWPRTSTTTT